MQQKTFAVQGMTCNGCANLVRSILEEDFEGVEKAEVSLELNQVSLTYDENKLDLQKAADELKQNGYILVV